MIRATLAVGVAALLGACATPPQAAPVAPSSAPGHAPAQSYYSFGPPADLIRADGQKSGTVQVAPWAGGVAIGVVAHGLAGRRWRADLRGTGRCDGPNFSSVGRLLQRLGAFDGQVPEPTTVTFATVNSEPSALGRPLTLNDLFDGDGSALVVSSVGSSTILPGATESHARIVEHYCAVLRAPVR